MWKIFWVWLLLSIGVANADDGRSFNYLYADCYNKADAMTIAQAFATGGTNAAIKAFDTVSEETRAKSNEEFCSLGLNGYHGVTGELKWDAQNIIWSSDDGKVIVIQPEEPIVFNKRTYYFSVMGAIDGGTLPKAK